MDKEELQELVEQRMSQRQIAERLGCSQTNVKYWLRVHQLSTNPQGNGGRSCKEHGRVGCNRCKRGGAQHVSNYRRKLKGNAVLARGGRCEHPSCPVSEEYFFDPGDLDFHHRDPSQKGRTLGNWSRSAALYREEVAKCDLLCALCHRRVEREKRLSVD